MVLCWVFWHIICKWIIIVIYLDNYSVTPASEEHDFRWSEHSFWYKEYTCLDSFGTNCILGWSVSKCFSLPYTYRINVVIIVNVKMIVYFYHSLKKKQNYVWLSFMYQIFCLKYWFTFYIRKIQDNILNISYMRKLKTGTYMG